MEVVGQFDAVLLQQLFFGLDVFGCALMYFRQFIGADFGMDDGVLLRLDNGTVDAVHDIVRTVLCRNQGIEGSTLTLGGMLQAAVYVIQLFLERIDFFQQIAKFA